jgi:glycerophosphoryl diester phosphodiesterase
MNSRLIDRVIRASLWFAAVALLSFSTRADSPMLESKVPVIIAHRGASGYLPEHTLEAKGMAHSQGADFLEQDLVLTKDDVPVVLHDIHLDTVTDVAQVFPGRARPDGRYYAIDFTLAEIRQLAVSERFDPKTGKAVFPNRFPPHTGRFRIPTFEEEIQFIQGLNKSTGRMAGIYPEIKQPEFHHQAGKDITAIVLPILNQYGYTTKQAPCFVQCFDHRELLRIRNEFDSQLRLVQLLSEKEIKKAREQSEGLGGFCQEIAQYADGIGPPLTAVFPDAASASAGSSELIEAAHAAGLLVHPWTYRADQLASGFHSFEELHRASIHAGVDGLFSDFPDQSWFCIQQ